MAKEKIKAEDKRALNKENFGKLYGIFRYLLPYKTKFIIGLVFLVLGSFLLLAFPLIAGKLIDVASGEGTWMLNDINSIALSLVGILFLQGIFSFFRVYLFAQVSENAMADVRFGLYKKILYLPISFFDKHRTGDLMSRMSSDVTLLQTTFSTTLAEVIRQVVTLAVGIAMIFINTPALSIFMLATFPVLIISAMLFGKKIRKLSRQSQDELAHSSTIVEETFQSILAVKSFTNELFEKLRYQKSLKQVVTTALKAATYRAGFISFIIFALFGGMVAIMWYGALLLQKGEMSVGDLISFAFYTAFIGGSIAGIGDLFGQIQRAIGASERILEIHEESSETEESENNTTPRLSGNISFEQVNFQYPSRMDMPVLHGLSMQVAAGEKVALVGKSGAGKSTIAHLLMRLYDGFSGSVKVDGQDISTYDLSDYRKNIGIVPQEVILFGGTIRENIAYGKLDASQEEIEAAAQKAHALDFIQSFPEGFDTLVGERGVKLSGGQRQRIAIARTILKDPAILILDEATSSLDAESEQQVQLALNELMKGRTTLIIAHRLATIKEVDRIYVIESGCIKESGAHNELIDNVKGTYHHLVNLQLVH
ncbi:ABC transporter transmembrane domain-containing protein [Reichenbachiella carrageenanivorans]|uniref:ABC transporter transmembrane domain-containing protein n=1 Tax=Reichenbachiella carrageenanivorans TaxID=2979869 RepID=A0ABY6D3G6_9BACT|nr:ABC transporter transmembrane domain-containing protein [Reichenbachiella carrageenanivorans]UXX80706.1 ABC transporter transmembrane domain-containing protein [Reichenbachiella carrageenanivorans]